MTTKIIVVLANSWKKGGRCLAGKEVQMACGQITSFGAWVRPISPGHVEVAGKSEGGQVTEPEMKRALNRAELPHLLEILEIPFARAVPSPEQPENWEVEQGPPWRSLGMCTADRLPQMVDAPAALWDTSGSGWTKVDESLSKDAKFASLYLVAPQGQLVAEVGSRPRTSASLDQVLYKNLLVTYAGLTHEFRISDPSFDAEYRGQFPQVGTGKKVFVMPRGTHVTVSLTPAFSFTGQPPRYHYKMAAAIIKPAK